LDNLLPNQNMELQNLVLVNQESILKILMVEKLG